MENNNILLSIIIPVYNVEKYLQECVKSIIECNFENYEIILVDDGSTDNSSMICDELEKKYHTTISVIHKNNGGLSSARNEGIKNAHGKYLMFIDSDDKINFFDLKKYIKNNPDIIQYKMVYYYEKNDRYIKLRDINVNENDNIMQFIENQIINGTLSISACDKIVKKDFIIKNDLYFEEGLLSEDIDWSLKIYLIAESIEAYNDEVYIYRQQRNNSITKTDSNKKITSTIFILEKWINYNYETDKIKKIYMNYLAYLYCILITISTKQNTTLEQKKYIKNCKSILKYNDNYKVKYCYKLFKIFGFTIGTFILKIYLKMKNRGMIKL